jgi:integrase
MPSLQNERGDFMNNIPNKLLIDLINYGNLSEDDVLESIYKMKKKKVLEIHPYAITNPKNKDARWQTFVSEANGRKKISAVSEGRLYQKLFDFYFIRDTSRFTIKSLYPEWLKIREEANLSDRTIQRYDNYWNKYYASNSIVNKPLVNIKPDHIEMFFHGCIKNYNMSIKELNNMKYLMKDILKMAVRQEIIGTNPFDVAEIKTYGCKPPNKKSDRSRVYLPDEKKRLFKALNEDISKHPDVTDAYAVFFLFKTGLRLGEIVAIKECDIDFLNKEIHIQRMESKKKDENSKFQNVIVDYTKTSNGNRFLPLDDYDLKLLKKVISTNAFYDYYDSGYIFVDGQGRTKSREIDNRIRKCCKAANIDVKSAHDIRRTVASEMHLQGIPIEMIRDYLGHSEISTTWGYIYDNTAKSERSRMITDALRTMNGLKRTQVS